MHFKAAVMYAVGADIGRIAQVRMAFGAVYRAFASFRADLTFRFDFFSAVNAVFCLLFCGGVAVVFHPMIALVNGQFFPAFGAMASYFVCRC